MRSARWLFLLLPLFLSLPLLLACGDAKGAHRLFGPSLHARESVLRTDLSTLRNVIGQYRKDKGRHPETLEALVQAGYLRKLPTDPLTRGSDTWIAVYAPPVKTAAGQPREIVDIRSGARGRGTDGRPYLDW